MSERPDLIGSAEVCTVLGIDRSTLIRWVQLDKIKPAMRLPGATGAFLFDPADVERRRAEYEAERAPAAEVAS